MIFKIVIKNILMQSKILYFAITRNKSNHLSLPDHIYIAKVHY
ncbi:hypothetical protein HRAG_02519, partial [Helicobacter bilis ATCC 43879]